jgi:hypothetical protein
MTLRTLTTSISIEARENSCDASYASLSGLEDPFPGRRPELADPAPLHGARVRRGEPRQRARIDATIVRPARNALPGKVKPDIEPAPPSTSRRDAVAGSNPVLGSELRGSRIDAAVRFERSGARPRPTSGGVRPPCVVSIGARARVAIVVSCAHQVRIPRERSRRSTSVSGR